MPNNDSGAAPRPWDATAWLAQHEGGAGDDTVSLGYAGLDALLGGGPRRGDLVVLAGDIGSGKSALAMGIALASAEAGLECTLFSGEAAVERLMERALASRARVRIDDLRQHPLDERVRTAVAAAAVALRECAPSLGYVPPNGFAGLSDLLIDQLGIALVVIDPVQSLVTGRRSRDEELADVVRELKGLAVRRNCVVLAVSHLEASLLGRSDPRPQLADLGALGALAQHADTVLALYREEQYHSDRDVDGAAEVHVLKSRTGPLGYADLFYYKRWLRFEDVV